MNQASPRMNPFQAIIPLGLMIAPTTTLLHRTMQRLGTTGTHHPNILLVRHHSLTHTPTILRWNRRSVALTSSSSLILPDILFPALSRFHLLPLHLDATSPCQHQPPRSNHNVVTIDFPCTQNWVTEGHQHPASILDQPPCSTKGLWMKHPQHNRIHLSADSMPLLAGRLMVGPVLCCHTQASWVVSVLTKQCMCAKTCSCVLLTLSHRSGWASDWDHNPPFASGTSSSNATIQPGYVSRDRVTRNSHGQVLSFPGRC